MKTQLKRLVASAALAGVTSCFSAVPALAALGPVPSFVEAGTPARPLAPLAAPRPLTPMAGEEANYNGTAYNTVEEAIAALVASGPSAGGRVRLEKNVNRKITIDAGNKSFILDLNSCTLSHTVGDSDDVTIEVRSGEVTIVNGTVRSVAPAGTPDADKDVAVINVADGAKVTIGGAKSLGNSNGAVVTGAVQPDQPLIRVSRATSSTTPTSLTVNEYGQVYPEAECAYVIYAEAGSAIAINNGVVKNWYKGTFDTDPHDDGLITNALLYSSNAKSISITGDASLSLQGNKHDADAVLLMGEMSGSTPRPIETEFSMSGGEIANDIGGAYRGFALAGSEKHPGGTISITGRSTLTSANGTAIFHPQGSDAGSGGTIAIGSGRQDSPVTVEGTTGITLRGGSLTVNVGTVLRSTDSTKYDEPTNGNQDPDEGTVNDGSALSVIGNAATGDIHLDIKGGVFGRANTNNPYVALYHFSKPGATTTTEADEFPTGGKVYVTVEPEAIQAPDLIKGMSKWAPRDFMAVGVTSTDASDNTLTEYVVGHSETSLARDEVRNLVSKHTMLGRLASGVVQVEVTVYDASKDGIEFDNTPTSAGALANGTVLTNATNSYFDATDDEDNPETKDDKSDVVRVTDNNAESPYYVKTVATRNNDETLRSVDPASHTVGFDALGIRNADNTAFLKTTALENDEYELRVTTESFGPENDDIALDSTFGGAPINWEAVPPEAVLIEQDPTDFRLAKVTVKKVTDTTITAYYRANPNVRTSVRINVGTDDPDNPTGPWSLAEAEVELDKDNWVLDPLVSEYRPAVKSVMLHGHSLAVGIDYTVSYANNMGEGYADDANEGARPTVVLTAASGSSWVVPGTTGKRYFSIAPFDNLVNADVELEWEPAPGVFASLTDDVYTYDGTAKEPRVRRVTLTDTDGATTELSLTTDYTVSYHNNTNAGTKDADAPPTVRISAAGAYKGSKDVHFTINPKDISASTYGAEVTLLEEVFTYNGRAHTPIVTAVKLNDGTLLNPSIDFTVTPHNNVRVSSAGNTPRVTIAGKGNYTGSINRNFTINPKSFLDASVTVSSLAPTQAYTGVAVTPEVTVTDTSVAATDPGNTVLVKGTDYTVTYSPVVPIDVGTEVTVTITGRGNYTGTSRTLNYKIARSMAGATMKLLNSLFTADGREHVPRATVTLPDGTELVENVDYQLSTSPENPVEPGEYVLVATGMGEYAGSVSKTYTIVQGTGAPTTPDSPDVPAKPEEVSPDKDPTDPYPNGDTPPILNPGAITPKKGDTATGEIIVGDEGEIFIELKLADGTPANGWQIVGGKTYYAEGGLAKRGLSLVEDRLFAFNYDGTLGSGLVKDYGTGKVYLAADASAVTPGLVQSNKWSFCEGNWYLTNRDGEVTTGWYLDNETGEKYYLYQLSDPERTGTMASGEWFYANGAWFVADDDGSLRTGWVTDAAGQRFYLNPTFGDNYGEMQTGWIVDPSNGQRYYLYQKGDLEQTGSCARNGWLYDGEKWYLTADDGHVCTGWAWDNSTKNWYYLNPTPGADFGQFETGWKYDAAYGCWFYLFTERDPEATGALARGGFLLVDGTWYLPNDAGEIRGGWQWFNGAWYHLHNTSDGTYGSLDVGWCWDGAGWYYLQPDGKMAIGFTDVGLDTYYLDDGTHGATGLMLSGWQWVNGVWYYFTGSGALLRNALTPDGYWVNLYGAWV